MKSASGSNKLTAAEIFQMRFSNSNLNFRAPSLILPSVNQYMCVCVCMFKYVPSLVPKLALSLSTGNAVPGGGSSVASLSSPSHFSSSPSMMAARQRLSLSHRNDLLSLWAHSVRQCASPAALTHSV